MSAERRKSPRYAVDLAAELSRAGVPEPARVKDICRDAALVEAAADANEGTMVGLVVKLSRSSSVELKGRVIRRAGRAGDAHAFAVLFGDVDPAAATEIEVLLARVEREGTART
ncbi:MAG TPA: PilZ domain-containing protein [Vicinamibacteria bacterium]|nr:PilZ domain-containing protein [Vicinamibacteria bacterium]